MSNIFFSSTLGREYRDDLEALMFFNLQQGKVKLGIIESVEKYGNPKIVVDGEFLRISVGEFSDVQSLFAFDILGKNAILIGIIVYIRIDIENIVVLHIGVREEYSISGSYGNEMLVMRLINTVRHIASRIKGVCSITILYQDIKIKIPV